MKKQLLLITLLSAFFSFGQVPTSERSALVALYNSTNGASWTNSTNWNTTQPVANWFGVTVANIMGQDHVTAIKFESLFGNNLNGTLPTQIGDFPELITLSIQYNSLLTGSIPTSIGNLSKLENLLLLDNDFTGNIPATIGNLSDLKNISLENNQLIGNIPTSFANLTNLETFWINGNQLLGNIPNIFSGWTNLAFFSIGSIPFGATVPSAPNNAFTGSLDLSNNSALRLCYVDNTLISTLNVKNGNNTNMPNAYFKANNVPNLTCVLVDNANYSTTTWIGHIASTITFVDTQAACNALAVSDITFEESIVLYPNPNVGILHIRNNGNSSINQITILNTLGQKVMDSQEVNDIDMTNLPTGMYYVNIENIKGDKASYKIIKK